MEKDKMGQGRSPCRLGGFVGGIENKESTNLSFI